MNLLFVRRWRDGGTDSGRILGEAESWKDNAQKKELSDSRLTQAIFLKALKVTQRDCDRMARVMI
jgi:hypothetical protein